MEGSDPRLTPPSRQQSPSLPWGLCYSATFHLCCCTVVATRESSNFSALPPVPACAHARDPCCSPAPCSVSWLLLPFPVFTIRLHFPAGVPSNTPSSGSHPPPSHSQPSPPLFAALPQTSSLFCSVTSLLSHSVFLTRGFFPGSLRLPGVAISAPSSPLHQLCPSQPLHFFVHLLHSAPYPHNSLALPHHPPCAPPHVLSRETRPFGSPQDDHSSRSLSRLFHELTTHTHNAALRKRGGAEDGGMCGAGINQSPVLLSHWRAAPLIGRQVHACPRP